jgi:hypothetical protein
LKGSDRRRGLEATTRAPGRPPGFRQPWETPILVEICVCIEINGYLPAVF